MKRSEQKKKKNDKKSSTNNNLRTKNKLIRFSSRELSLIEKKMEETGVLNFSQYVRQVSIQGKIITIDFVSIKKLTNEINKIGVNINQIAKINNSNGYISKDEFRALQLEVNKLHTNVREMIHATINQSL